MHLFRAYLDAGSASMLLQLLLGGFAAVAVGAKLYWGRLMRLLHIRKPEAEPAEPVQAQAQVPVEPAIGASPPVERAVVESQSR
jgi:hypothetical protein